MKRLPCEIVSWHPTARPFLVCVRAGDSSTHHLWFDPGQPRRWDLFLHYYKVPPGGVDLRAEMVATGGVSKLAAIRQMLDVKADAFSSYEAVLFLDDDMGLAHGALDVLFWHFQRHGLDLGQPALTHDSPHSWPITLACPAFQVRFTDFIEIMMPLFSRHALSVCVDSFAENVSGWGLDFIWPQLLGAPRDKVGIIDAVAFQHRKIIDPENGPFYRFVRSLGREPHAEMREVLARYGVTSGQPRMLGGVVGTPAAPRRVVFSPV